MPTVMIVDDSPTDIFQTQQILELHGFEVISSDSALNAIEMAKTVLPDIILMDVVMPGINGFRATREIKNSSVTSGIPIIMLTNKDQETDRVWARRQGADDFLSKPVDETILLDAIKKALSEEDEQ